MVSGLGSQHYRALGNLQAQQRNHAQYAHAQDAAAQRQVAAPGAGQAFVQGRRVELCPISTSGLISAFAHNGSRAIAERGARAYSVGQVQQVFAMRGQLAAQAQREMQQLYGMSLERQPQAKQHIEALSHASIMQATHGEQREIAQGLEFYLGAQGDNLLMSIAAMGYACLDDYLQARDEAFRNPENVRAFLDEFALLRGLISLDSDSDSDDEDDDSILDDLGTRLESVLSQPAQALCQHLQRGERLADQLPLIKGIIGTDNHVTTQVDGRKLIESAMNGHAIHFNGLLSTTSSPAVGLEFCGRTPQSGLGAPLYHVDLNNAQSDVAEVLRRETLNMRADDDAFNSIYLVMNTNGVTGVSVGATREALAPGSLNARERAEDEILLPPGYFFQAEKVIRNTDGFAVIGQLHAS